MAIQARSDSSFPDGLPVRRSGAGHKCVGPDPCGGPARSRKFGWPRIFKRAAQPGSWRLQLAPLPAWSAPRVRQDQRGGLSWTLLHLGLAAGSTHLGFDFPKLAVGADVDVPARKPDVTIPPVMLNSHATHPKPDIDQWTQRKDAKLPRCPTRHVVRSGGLWRDHLHYGGILGQHTHRHFR